MDHVTGIPGIIARSQSDAGRTAERVLSTKQMRLPDRPGHRLIGQGQRERVVRYLVRADNAVHLSQLRRKRQLSHPASEDLRRLRDRLLEQGPGALSRRELVALLRSREVMRELHERLWTQPEARLSSWWRLAMRHYNTLTVRPQTALYR